MATNKKLDVPDIGGLLGKISERRQELPKAPIQAVQPVNETPSAPTAQEAAKPAIRENGKTAKQPVAEPRGPGGRPSVKKDGVDYVKLSPRIPKGLKRRVEIALAEERFRDDEDRPVKTIDEIIALALERLLA